MKKELLAMLEPRKDYGKRARVGKALKECHANVNLEDIVFWANNVSTVKVSPVSTTYRAPRKFVELESYAADLNTAKNLLARALPSVVVSL